MFKEKYNYLLLFIFILIKNNNSVPSTPPELSDAEKKLMLELELDISAKNLKKINEEEKIDFQYEKENFVFLENIFPNISDKIDKMNDKEIEEKIQNVINNFLEVDSYKLCSIMEYNKPSLYELIIDNKSKSKKWFKYYNRMNNKQKEIYHKKIQDGFSEILIEKIKANSQILFYTVGIACGLILSVSFISNFLENISNNALQPFFNRWGKHKTFLAKLNFEYITNYNLSNIAGYHNIKKIFMEIAKDLNDQKKNLSKMEGICLYGEPGNGKTQIIKALAGQAEVPLIIINLNTLLNENGQIEENINLLFEEVRRKAPCILLLDEFDLITGSRKYGKLTDNEKSILNELLQQLDGTRPLEGVLVVANTNIIDNIDLALTRPGRLGRVIEIGSPSEEDISEIIVFYLNEYDIKYDKNVLILIKNKVLELTKINVASIKNLIQKIKKACIKKNISDIKEKDFKMIENEIF